MLVSFVLVLSLSLLDSVVLEKCKKLEKYDSVNSAMTTSFKSDTVTLSTTDIPELNPVLYHVSVWIYITHPYVSIY